MQTSVSVIGPVQERLDEVADELRQIQPQWQVLVGAGPDARPTAVVAVVERWDAASCHVVGAVASGQGCVIVLTRDDPELSDAEPPDLPGISFISTVEEIPAAVRTVAVSVREWSSDAYRADAERVDRVKIAIRLGANRSIQGLCDQGIGSSQEWDRAYWSFVEDLQAETLRQGVAFPSMELAPPECPRIPVEASWGRIALALATTCGAFAAPFGLGRALGQPMLGLLVGLVLAVIVAGIRLWMMHAQYAKAARQQRAVQLKQDLTALTAAMTSRVQIARVAPALT
ncbi:hypothetical protein GC425_08735 [Corynebacterium sp. zg254]|uniref:Uncharacterized protein n=1 Tax=Corynebacterium zhongnanshanii TaxID=2768834 RepID=A0ABQ6VCQ8_9CORY|nr:MULTISPECIES: hypothetical protein [Corynebacterium]KAB3519986.1 hypothetical protein F8377_08775 [Corynebacterium zhongnanshanii]MCR5914936.1 hypothetical protein [Corynebacterium sp. zg254]